MYHNSALFITGKTILLRDLLHLLKNTFDRKRIYTNPSSYSKPNTNPPPRVLKRNNVFGLMKSHHFSIKSEVYRFRFDK